MSEKLNNFKGALPNGISLNTSIDDARKIDPNLKFNDREEVFESSEGYLLEDYIETKAITAISIFIPELLHDDFYEYNW